MADASDGFRYIRYVRLRWRFVAASCLIAVAFAGAVSLALPREYTATARIVIEPPAGADPRSATAVSAVYLESLKTYEQFAGNDSLFQKAAVRFQLRALLGARPIESIKKSVLRVGMIRNTRILEIAATLPDPARAQALVQFLAEEAVRLNRSLTAESERDLIQGIEQQEREARAHLAQDGEKRDGTAGAADAIDTQLREGRNDVGYRGERLSIIDPGVVPEQPSSPDVPMNLAAALVLGLLLQAVYLALALGFQQQRAESRRGGLQTLYKTGDE